MTENLNIKLAFKNFLKHFKKYKLLLSLTIIGIILTSILSIIIPLKIGNITDTIMLNIKIKNNNKKTYEIIDNYKPFISDIEQINFEALSSVLDSATINDLVNYGFIKKESTKNIDQDILTTDAYKFEIINCYDCNDKDFINPINDIYNIIEKNDRIKIENIEIKSIVFDLVTVVTLVLIIFIINYFSNLAMCKISKDITYNLRDQINKKLFKVSLNYYTKNKQGDILSIITNDLDNISTTISTEIVGIIKSIILFFSLLIIMFSISIKLTIIIIAIIPIIIILLLITVIKSSKYYKENQDTLGKYNDFILNSYKGYKTIKCFNQTNKFIDKEENINSILYKNTWKSNFISSLMQPIVQFSSNINFLIVCIFGSILVIKGNITLGNLQAFLTYAKNFNSPLISIASTIGILEQALVSNERINYFLMTEEEKEINKLKKYNFNQDITFKNIDFSYTEKKVLENINFTIKKGQKIAIVGETGSGKTTLIKLLLNLYQPTNGEILIGNKNIQEIDRTTLRNNIGVVLQDSWLFEGTIQENIDYGNSNDINDVKKAAKLTNLDEIIAKLPNNYNFLIDDNNKLSKGEKQLISIARVFMHKKDILILDEATSNIDIETEIKIKDAINKLMKDKTCLIIAHRLSTIINSDNIIVMHQGKIVETGTHKELLKLHGYYYKLYKSQFE